MSLPDRQSLPDHPSLPGKSHRPPVHKHVFDGRLLFEQVALGDDDVHQLQSKGEAIEALPGQAWIYVRAKELSPTAILSAIDNGDFYASTGVQLSEYKADRSEVSIKVKATNYSKYRIQFIGSGGKVLQESLEPNGVYKIKGSEGYVRAKIYESNGRLAWTQPMMLK